MPSPRETPNKEPLRLDLLNERGEPRLTPTTVSRLLGALDADRSAPYVVLEGGSKAFCEGLDLSFALPSKRQGSLRGILSSFSRLLGSLSGAPKPVIALVDGPAFGGGLGLATTADLLIASPRAAFALPEALVGLLPALVLPFVARRTGLARAKLLALEARTVSAEEALRIGLVDVIADDVKKELASRVRRFCRADARALAGIKALAGELSGQSRYADAAARRFLKLARSRETQARLARYDRGEAPWPEEEARVNGGTDHGIR